MQSQATSIPSDHDGLAEAVRIIAKELHVPESELEDDDAEFSELGVDALLATTITAKIAQTTGVQLPDDIFQIFPTVGAFRKHFTVLARKNQECPVEEVQQGTEPRREVLAVLVRNSTAKGARNLFLLPDGSGAAMAYARLPPIPHARIYAMNSPFLQDASRYTCSIENLSSIWTDAIMQIQPRGPYLLGGWSAGGYYAYEVMRHLQRRGEVVETIVLIDSPCRTDFEALPLDVVLYLAKHGLMGVGGAQGNTTPAWLVDHFAATLKAVDRYSPKSLDVGMVSSPPKVFVIWASESLLEAGQAEAAGLDPSVKVTQMLLHPRSDFGPNAWDKLFPGASLMIAKVPCHHFNIVHPRNAEKLGSLLYDVAHPHGESAWRNKWRMLNGPS